MAQETARAYWRITVLWLTLGCGLGVACASALAFPAAFSSHPTTSVGRLISAHRFLMVHGFMFSAVFATGYTCLTALTRVPVSPRPVSHALAWCGGLIVALGALAILTGHGSGQEYVDLPAGLGVVFWLYLMAVAIDFSVLASQGAALTPHPSLGLLLPAVILPAVIYPFCLPDWWGSGVFAAARIWTGVRAILMLSFVLAAIAAGLTIRDSSSERKLPRGAYLVGITLILALGPFLGLVHMLDAPVAAPLKALGAFAGVMVSAGLILVMTVFAAGVPSSPPEVLLWAGSLGIIATAIQGAVMVFPPVYSAFHFTENTSAHAHLALGSLACIFLAGALRWLATVAGHRVRLPGLAASAIGAFLLGLLVLIGSLEAAGVIQAAAAARSLSYTDWMHTFKWLMALAGTAGVAVLAGAAVLAAIVFATLAETSRQSVSIQAKPECGESTQQQEPFAGEAEM